MNPRLRITAAACLLLVSTAASSQVFRLQEADLQKRANGVLTIMGFTLTPDVTTGSLAINDGRTQDPRFNQTSMGGGDTVYGRIYLEGTIGYSRYDPTFVASNGIEQRSLPLKWNSFTATGGIGYDFPIGEHLKFRPILSLALGHVESDVSVAGRIVGNEIDREIAFAQDGRLNAYGVGGALMLDYEDYNPAREIDVELRFSAVPLRSFGDTTHGVQGTSHANSLGLWSRWRAPTGMTMLDRPLRYVLEYAHTTFLGNLNDVMSFNHLNSLGVGLEVDSSKYDIFVTRWRAVMRYVKGQGVEGWSLGLAVSF